MSELQEEIERIKQFIEKGCMVFIGNKRVVSIDTIKGKKGGLIAVVNTTSGNLMVYVNKLLTEYRITVVCNGQE